MQTGAPFRLQITGTGALSSPHCVPTTGISNFRMESHTDFWADSRLHSVVLFYLGQYLQLSPPLSPGERCPEEFSNHQLWLQLLLSHICLLRHLGHLASLPPSFSGLIRHVHSLCIGSPNIFGPFFSQKTHLLCFC